MPVCVTLLAYLCPRLAAAVLDSWDTEGSWLQALARTVARSSPYRKIVSFISQS